MKTKILFFAALFILLICHGQLNAQTRFLNKIKDKAEDKMIESLFEEDEKNEQQQSSQQNQQTYNNNSGRQNTSGGGLSTDIDVEANIEQASSSFNDNDYSGSRFAIRQAMQGIELEMGKNVLESMPEEVDGLPANMENDQVTSSGVGFAGLYIERMYEKGNKELDVVVSNNSVWISAVNMYMGSSAYASEEEQYKQIQFQGNQGVVEFDSSSGYKLSVPFGQSSILVVKGINYETEQAFMSACENFKIDTIKEKLGEK